VHDADRALIERRFPEASRHHQQMIDVIPVAVIAEQVDGRAEPLRSSSPSAFLTTSAADGTSSPTLPASAIGP
jgi:hypothetical protein